MDQLDIAIHQTAHGDHPGDLEALARKMGIGAQILRNKVCPTIEWNKLTLREAVAMMDSTGDDRILAVIADMRGYVLERKKLPDAASIVQAVLSADVEHGDVSRAISDALADGKLTGQEKAAIARQIREAQQTLDALNSTVQHAPTHMVRGTP